MPTVKWRKLFNLKFYIDVIRIYDNTSKCSYINSYFEMVKNAIIF